MKLIISIVGVGIISAIALVSGFMWGLFLPGTGLVVGIGTFLTLLAMSSVKT